VPIVLGTDERTLLAIQKVFRFCEGNPDLTPIRLPLVHSNQATTIATRPFDLSYRLRMNQCSMSGKVDVMCTTMTNVGFRIAERLFNDGACLKRICITIYYRIYKIRSPWPIVLPSPDQSRASNKRYGLCSALRLHPR
jgi:hypothetical protein